MQFLFQVNDLLDQMIIGKLSGFVSEKCLKYFICRIVKRSPQFFGGFGNYGGYDGYGGYGRYNRGRSFGGFGRYRGRGRGRGFQRALGTAFLVGGAALAGSYIGNQLG